MDFFEQLDTRTDLPEIDYPHVPRAKGLGDRLLARYLKRFGKGLGPMKPIAKVNGDMAVYDLTQPPMGSAAGSRVLRTGLNYVLLRREARPINMGLQYALCALLGPGLPRLQPQAPGNFRSTQPGRPVC